MKDDLTYTIYLASRKILRTYLDSFREEGFDLSTEQWITISLIHNGMVKNQQDIANLSGKDKTTVTRALEVLLNAGLITRKVDPDDRRANLISLSQKGKKLREKMQPVYDRVRDEILSNFNKKELEANAAFLEKLIGILD